MLIVGVHPGTAIWTSATVLNHLCKPKLEEYNTPLIIQGGNALYHGNGQHKAPFTRKSLKPTRARLVSLLDPLGRKRYCEMERFLATIKGFSCGLFHSPDFGWAIRYSLGAKTTLCTLHLLPNSFEATVALGKEMDEPLKNAAASPDLKRRIARSKAQNGKRVVRLPIRNDSDCASFKMLINLKAEALRIKNLSNTNA